MPYMHGFLAIQRSQMATKSNQASESVILEVGCPYCMGRPKEREEGSGRLIICPMCKGAGFIPTEVGRQILDLVRHNLERLQNGD
jgi:hypothetical protein